MKNFFQNSHQLSEVETALKIQNPIRNEKSRFRLAKNSFAFLFLIFGALSFSQDDLGVIRDDGTLEFLDALGEKHTMQVDNGAPKNVFKKECWKMSGEKMLYEGDERFSVRHGLDISRHDGDVDWNLVKKAGFEFVILRIAYRRYQAGTLHEDENFSRNFEGARKAGLDVGVYIFSQAIDEDEAKEEADFVLKILDGKKLQLPVVFDPENILDDDARTDNISGAQFTKNADIFCAAIRAAGYKPMIYANLMWEAFQFDMAHFAKMPFWYADYEPFPQTPYDFEFWQYTAKGTVPGCPNAKKTDLDIQIIKKRN